MHNHITPPLVSRVARNIAHIALAHPRLFGVSFPGHEHLCGAVNGDSTLEHFVDLVHVTPLDRTGRFPRCARALLLRNLRGLLCAAMRRVNDLPDAPAMEFERVFSVGGALGQTAQRVRRGHRSSGIDPGRPASREIFGNHHRLERVDRRAQMSVFAKLVQNVRRDASISRDLARLIARRAIAPSRNELQRSRDRRRVQTFVGPKLPVWIGPGPSNFVSNLFAN